MAAASADARPAPRGAARSRPSGRRARWRARARSRRESGCRPRRGAPSCDRRASRAPRRARASSVTATSAGRAERGEGGRAHGLTSRPTTTTGGAYDGVGARCRRRSGRRGDGVGAAPRRAGRRARRSTRRTWLALASPAADDRLLRVRGAGGERGEQAAERDGDGHRAAGEATKPHARGVARAGSRVVVRGCSVVSIAAHGRSAR